MRKLILGAAIAALAAAPAVVIGNGAAAEQTAGAQDAGEQEYVVVYTEGVSLDAARDAVAAAGGTIVNENTDVGVATVVTNNADFVAAASAQDALMGTAQNRVIGAAPDLVAGTGEGKKFDPAEADLATVAGAPTHGNRPGRPAPNAEPLADLQWDMAQIGATVDGSYRFEKGSSGVRVGILDTGVDGTHPDIAPNFHARLSRNFTVDIPVDANGANIDGPCAAEPDQSCEDASDVDENGHGTHVASTIASPMNGIGIAGVAPKATIVNLRAGQDSGYFFLQPSVDALTYAGNSGIDVVNMSYYVDPWLFNCSSHPADSPEDRAEQQAIVEAMQRALDFAYEHGVTLVAAAGNGATDYTKIISDASSPDFADTPGEAPYVRDLLDPATCISMPSEGDGVISVSSTGISARKAYYSDYGNGYVDIAAPGGDVYDTPDNNRDITKAVLAAYPESLARARGQLDPSGNPNTPNVVKSCDTAGTCAYYQYLQGTSMASPHTAGVAALIVSKYGERDHNTGGLGMAPGDVEAILRSTATDTPCPVPPAFTYTRHVPVAGGGTVTVTATHVCEGDPAANGFYGDGIINATKAVGH
ncbi:MAG TPA: S8 family serine peptidase [Ilumatobacteraceae bacterium]|nr:S8 family serine peptidase [Ilumatobacteraceae bacterium]